MKLNTNRILIAVVIIVLNIALDQYTKVLAFDHLKGIAKESYLGDLFYLHYVENTGAFLSLGSDLNPTLQLILLKVLPVVMLVTLLWYTLFSGTFTRLQSLAMSFILGGGISNIYDRINFGKVIDFMNMGIGDLRTGIFNFADVSIMVGIGLFLFAGIRDSRQAKKEQANAEKSTSEESTSTVVDADNLSDESE